MVINNVNTGEDILYPEVDLGKKIRFIFSFNKFLDKLKGKLENNSQRTEFYAHWLSELRKQDEWLASNHSTDDSSFLPFFEFIQHALFGPIHGNDLMWGIIQPVPPYCIYSTPALSGLLEQDIQVRLKPGVYVNIQENSHLIWNRVIYSFILQELYGFSMNKSVGIILRLDDVEAGLVKYFGFEIDTSYLEVTVEGDLPHLAIEDISAQDEKGTLFDFLPQVLPLNIFCIKGFASLRVKEDNTRYVLEEIRAAIIHRTTDSIVETTKLVLEMLKSLVQNSTVQFGLLPFLKLNGKLVIFDLARQLSILLNAFYAQSVSSHEILHQLEQFHNDPKMIIAHKKSGEKVGLLQGIFEQGDFQTIVLLPIYHQSQLVGLLEMATTRDCDLSKQINVFALEQALPWLAELVYRDNTEFNNQISQIVQAKFTSIHPSVQWKINESAFMFLKNQVSVPQQTVISNIVFEQVYPLYGAVDIRNSTAIRNNASRDDLIIQLTYLKATLQAINNEFGLKVIDAKLSICEKWLHVLEISCSAEIELSIYSFIENEINPFFNYYNKYFPQLGETILRYYEATDPLTGSAGKNRRALEKTMHIVNNSINNQIEALGSRIQALYPSYFESFRTDGVEYDIYLGQSIAPGKPFDDHYLHEYRLLQLISMAEIARNTNSLLSEMEVPLHTAQLIFVSNTPIDISFRNDEKRFDVEGAYNIRYQIIKKRIDKVHIKGTSERLTQPGKIAIIYIDAAIRREYEKYISYGQQQGYFEEIVEFHDLEDLQDVSGLKAIRISVKYDCN